MCSPPGSAARRVIASRLPPNARFAGSRVALATTRPRRGIRARSAGVEGRRRWPSQFRAVCRLAREPPAEDLPGGDKSLRTVVPAGSSCRRRRPPPSAPRPIAGQGLAAFVQVALTPQINRVAADPEPSGDFARRQTLAEQKHQAASKRRALRRGGRADPPLERRAIALANDHVPGSHLPRPPPRATDHRALDAAHGIRTRSCRGTSRSLGPRQWHSGGRGYTRDSGAERLNAQRRGRSGHRGASSRI